jgi:Tfp pilus assembly protein PilN
MSGGAGVAKLCVMQNTNTTDHRPAERTAAAFRTVKLLVGGYVGLSVLTLVAAYFMRDTAAVTDAVWVRGIIVVLASLVMAWSAASAARGSRRALRRVRILATVMTVAIVVIVALPGLFPVWMKVEQGVCGVLLVGVIVLARRLQRLAPTTA